MAWAKILNLPTEGRRRGSTARGILKLHGAEKLQKLYPPKTWFLRLLLSLPSYFITETTTVRIVSGSTWPSRVHLLSGHGMEYRAPCPTFFRCGGDSVPSVPQQQSRNSYRCSSVTFLDGWYLHIMPWLWVKGRTPAVLLAMTMVRLCLTVGVFTVFNSQCSSQCSPDQCLVSWTG